MTPNKDSHPDQMGSPRQPPAGCGAQKSAAGLAACPAQGARRPAEHKTSCRAAGFRAPSLASSGPGSSGRPSGREAPRRTWVAVSGLVCWSARCRPGSRAEEPRTTCSTSPSSSPSAGARSRSASSCRSLSSGRASPSIYGEPVASPGPWSPGTCGPRRWSRGPQSERRASARTTAPRIPKCLRCATSPAPSSGSARSLAAAGTARRERR
mmetsp:Transcript_157942/g.506569  ORF Transcript_157942/g.506569 Transcript_157942/m.506569 type:complete len:210 (-) Transcript_157942:712-1341(-)